MLDNLAMAKNKDNWKSCSGPNHDDNGVTVWTPESGAGPADPPKAHTGSWETENSQWFYFERQDISVII